MVLTECQWAQSLTRKQGSRKAASAMPEGDGVIIEDDTPPNCNLGPWTAVAGPTLAWLEQMSGQPEGMHSYGTCKYLTVRDAKNARTCEPHFSRSLFPHRTIFGYFPEFHQWFKLATLTDYSGNLATASFGCDSNSDLCFPSQLIHPKLDISSSSSKENKTGITGNVDEEAPLENENT